MMSHGERRALRRLENATGMGAISGPVGGPTKDRICNHGILSGKLLCSIEQMAESVQSGSD